MQDPVDRTEKYLRLFDSLVVLGWALTMFTFLTLAFAYDWFFFAPALWATWEFQNYWTLWWLTRDDD